MAAGGEDRTELIVIPENEEPDQLVTVELHLNEETTSIIQIESNETVSTSSACNQSEGSTSQITVSASTSGNNPIAGPNTSREVTTPTNESEGAKMRLNYDNFEFSPFKRYLKISDSVIVTRKVNNPKAKTPSAISGEDYYKSVLRTTLRKEKRKKNREEKKTPKVLHIPEKRKRRKRDE